MHHGGRRLVIWWGYGMKRFPMGMVLVASLAIGACAQVITDKEDMLAAAGFKLQPANTPQRQAALRAMPVHKLSMQNRNGKIVWVYADPTICNCVYLGDEQAYDAYRRMVYQKNLADERMAVAQMTEYSAVPYPFAWDTWGPGTPYY